MEQMESLYTGRVELRSGKLNVRDNPEGKVIHQLEAGSMVEVLLDEGEWVKIGFEGGIGYAAKQYICFAQAKQEVRLVIEDEEGKAYTPKGGFTLRIASGPID